MPFSIRFSLGAWLAGGLDQRRSRLLEDARSLAQDKRISNLVRRDPDRRQRPRGFSAAACSRKSRSKNIWFYTADPSKGAALRGSRAWRRRVLPLDALGRCRPLLRRLRSPDRLAHFLVIDRMGMAGEDELPVNLDLYPLPHCLRLVYEPRETQLLRRAGQRHDRAQRLPLRSSKPVRPFGASFWITSRKAGPDLMASWDDSRSHHADRHGQVDGCEMFAERGIPVRGGRSRHRLTARGHWWRRSSGGFRQHGPQGVTDQRPSASGDRRGMAAVETIVHPPCAGSARPSSPSTTMRRSCCSTFPCCSNRDGRDFDVVIVVTAPAEVQRRRVLARAGMRPQFLDVILQRQLPDAEKKARADFLIDNGSTLAATEAQVEDILTRLRELAAD